jgi:hypothetical protein
LAAREAEAEAEAEDARQQAAVALQQSHDLAAARKRDEDARRRTSPLSHSLFPTLTRLHCSGTHTYSSERTWSRGWPRSSSRRKFIHVERIIDLWDWTRGTSSRNDWTRSFRDGCARCTRPEESGSTEGGGRRHCERERDSRVGQTRVAWKLCFNTAARLGGSYVGLRERNGTTGGQGRAKKRNWA